MEILEALFRFAVVTVLLGYSWAQIDEQIGDKSRDDSDNNRALNLGLDRGLQMLRLGKRFARQGRSFDDQNNQRLSPSEIQAVLDSIFVDSDSREEYRRQPPLPRYGRDSSTNRPAPRGGRYKKSLPVGRFTSGDYFTQDIVDHAGGITFPRFEQFVEELTYTPKAVSRPRMGRIHSDYPDDSFQVQSS